jgi:hypothetical protein
MRALSIVHNSTGRSLEREFYPMRFLWHQMAPRQPMIISVNLLHFKILGDIMNYIKE